MGWLPEGASGTFALHQREKNPRRVFSKRRHALRGDHEEFPRAAGSKISRRGLWRRSSTGLPTARLGASNTFLRKISTSRKSRSIPKTDPTTALLEFIDQDNRVFHTAKIERRMELRSNLEWRETGVARLCRFAAVFERFGIERAG